MHMHCSLFKIKSRYKKYENFFVDMSKCDHRLWIELNGPEMHIYNRSKLYSKLEEKFGLEPQIIPKDDRNEENDDDFPPDGPVKDMKVWAAWRDLIPVIKVDLNMVSNSHFLFATLFRNSKYIYR